MNNSKVLELIKEVYSQETIEQTGAAMLVLFIKYPDVRFTDVAVLMEARQKELSQEPEQDFTEYGSYGENNAPV